MALTELLFGGPRKAQIGVVQFDASISESHISESEVTDHPVEVGSDISDHVRRLPENIEINGMVTNTPVVFLASLRAPSPLTNSRQSSDDRVEDAYAELRRVKDAGEMVDVVTSLREYENMVITSISVSRDVSTGNVLNASVSLREMLIANALSIDLPDPRDIVNKAKKKLGKKSVDPASAKQAEKAQSLLSQLAGSIGF